MGILAKLFAKKEAQHISPSRKDDEQQQAAPAPEAPVMSVRLDEERRETWSNAFRAALWEIMGTLGIFSDADMEDMCQLATENGLEDQRYYQIIFARYFQDREWMWPTWEEWKKRFASENLWPKNWGTGDEHWENIERFNMLMKHINYKAKNEDSRQRLKKNGISAATVVVMGNEADKLWVERCLAESPEELPPYFPGDCSRLRPIVDSYKKNYVAKPGELVIEL